MFHRTSSAFELPQRLLHLLAVLRPQGSAVIVEAVKRLIEPSRRGKFAVNVIQRFERPELLAARLFELLEDNHPRAMLTRQLPHQLIERLKHRAAVGAGGDAQMIVRRRRGQATEQYVEPHVTGKQPADVSRDEPNGGADGFQRVDAKKTEARRCDRLIVVVA